MSDENKLIQDMVNQVSKYLEALDELILSMQKQPNNLRLIDEIEQKFKIIESTVSFYEFNNVALLAGSAKELLGSLFIEKVGLSVEHVSSLLSCVDAIREMQQEIKKTGHEPIFIYADIVVNIKKLIEGVDSLTKLGLSDDELAALPKRSKTAEEPIVEQKNASAYVDPELESMSDDEMEVAMMDESGIHTASDDDIDIDEAMMNDLMEGGTLFEEDKPIEQMTDEEMQAVMLDESSMHKDPDNLSDSAEDMFESMMQESVVNDKPHSSEFKEPEVAIDEPAASPEAAAHAEPDPFQVESEFTVDEPAVAPEPVVQAEPAPFQAEPPEPVPHVEPDPFQVEPEVTIDETAVAPEPVVQADPEVAIDEPTNTMPQVEDDLTRLMDESQNEVEEIHQQHEEVNLSPASLNVGSLQIEEVIASSITISAPNDPTQAKELEEAINQSNLNTDALQFDQAIPSLDESQVFDADLSDVEDLLDMCEEITGEDTSTTLEESTQEKSSAINEESAQVEMSHDHKTSSEIAIQNQGKSFGNEQDEQTDELVRKLKSVLMESMKGSIKKVLEKTYVELFNEELNIKVDSPKNETKHSDNWEDNSDLPKVRIIESSRLMKNVLAKALNKKYQLKFLEEDNLKSLLESNMSQTIGNVLILDPNLIKLSLNEVLCHLRQRECKGIVYTDAPEQFEEIDLPVISKPRTNGDKRISKRQSIKMLKEAILNAL